jgi:hypothetical protein
MYNRLRDQYLKTNTCCFQVLDISSAYIIDSRLLDRKWKNFNGLTGVHYFGWLALNIETKE